MISPHQLALGHLHAAMAAMVESGDTLAAAVIAQAVTVVERDRAAEAGAPTLLAPAANRRPC